MKKVFVLMSMAAAMVSFAGCQKNEAEGVGKDASSTGSTFELLADIAQTKTTLDGDYKVEWEEGDVIYMVTSDGTWGKPYSEDNTTESIAEFTYADGKFSTDATIADGSYTFNAIYSNGSQMSYHRSNATTNMLAATQSQDCSAPTAHIKQNDALVGTFTAEVPMAESAKITMAHLYTLMQVDVKNNTGADIQVTKFEMTVAGADLAGVFNVDAFGTPAISAREGEAATETITVNVANGTVASGSSLPVYFVMAPLSDYSGDVTFKVTDSENKTYTKTVTVTNLSFAAGKYNTTPYTISTADETSSGIDIADGTYVIAVKEEGAYYAVSTDANNSRRAFVELIGYTEGVYVSHNSKIVWTISNVETGITVCAGDQFWGAVKNGISLVESAEASIISVINSETEGAYFLSADCGSDGIRCLSKNASYGFGFYAESNKEDIYLIPTTLVELPTLAVPVVTAELNASNDGITVFWNKVENAEKYVVTCGDGTAEVTTLSCEFAGLSSGTYSISVTAIADNYNSATSEPVTITVPAEEGAETTYVFAASDLTAGTSYNNGKVNGKIAYKLGSSSKTGTLTFPKGYSKIILYAVGWNSGTNTLSITNGTINAESSITLINHTIASGTINNNFEKTGDFDDSYKYTIKVTDTSIPVVLSLKRGIVWGFEGVLAD